MPDGSSTIISFIPLGKSSAFDGAKGFGEIGKRNGAKSLA
jgi:hypothetical protein